MSPRRPAALRDSSMPGLREHLVATAAALLAERGGAGLSVRDIARAAQVADGVLYNYFEDKDDLLAHGLLAHVGAVMHEAPGIAPPGSGTVEANLAAFIAGGLAVLGRVTPAFAGLLSQPAVLARFHAMVGGDAAFGTADPEPEPEPEPEAPQGLPAILEAYLRAEQGLGRVRPDVDVVAAATLVVGAIHGEVLPRVFFGPPGAVIEPRPGLPERLAAAVARGLV